MKKNKKWGFIRETSELAKKSGIDKKTGILRTGLNEYLGSIFPNIKDWEHDKVIPNSNKKYRPDYRSEKLKLIVEFDGLPHYQNPDIIQLDNEKDIFYNNLGYKVVRIPYFIQLTNKAIKTLFSVDIKEEMFNDNVPSLSIDKRNTPAYLCSVGIERMANEFKKFPDQYEINIKSLEKENNEFLTGTNLLKLKYVE